MNAQLLAKLFGVVFILIGVLGFVPGITTSEGYLLGIFEVDAIHNIVHLLTGIVALMVRKSDSASRMYLKVFGVVYALVAIVGFIAGGEILGLFHANPADNVLHTLIAVVALIVGFGGKKSASVQQSGQMNDQSVGGQGM